MVFGKVYYHLLSTGETNIPWIAFYFFFNSESGLILCIGHRNAIHPYPLGSCGPFQENYACNIPYHNHETGPGIKLATFGLVDEFSTKGGNLLLTHAQPLS